MFKNISFFKRLFLYLSLVFVVFAISIMVFQYGREKRFKQQQLENTLDNITEISHNYIEKYKIEKSGDYRLLDSLNAVLPDLDIRITVINLKGVVLYDSEVGDYSAMENHLLRPEIQASIATDFGSNIRKSSTTGQSYYYYAKFFSNYYLRTATVYDIQVKDFLKAEKMFILYLLFIFVIIWIILLLITRKLGESITKLKDFAIKLQESNEIEEKIEFPNDELGVISSQIVTIYNKLNIAKNEVLVEKNKLHSHLYALKEGIAFFTPDKKKILTNNHFIQFLNLISEKSSISAEKIFEVKELEPIIRFLETEISKDIAFESDTLPFTEQDLYVNERYFNVRCIIFSDKNFEIVITDTTKLEKRKLIKQQMTSNIAHELKTPVATVMGYLETIQNNNITDKKRAYFVDKAFNQAKRLSDLIEDISVLNRIDEDKEHFVFEEINLKSVIEEVNENLSLRIQEKNIKVNLHIDDQIMLKGNKSLLFSIFYNLYDNVIKYGGENLEINVSKYLEDKGNFYFSFANTGNDVDEKHMARIFERFYRVDTGRARKNGGTGLGLAIVKNAIELHKGTIKARKYKDGGIEFLFSLSK